MSVVPHSAESPDSMSGLVASARQEPPRLGFWEGYWRSLKPLEVEEPVDVWVHRPLAYLLARAALPTPISPNLITLGSIVCGLAAGVAMLSPDPSRLALAGAFIFMSAVLDCADGQLARLRKTSSALGRMLDGVADLVVSSVVVLGGTWVLWNKYHEPLWLGIVTVVLAGITIVTSSFHTGMYDHYKNVFLRLTSPNFKEGEDYATALERFRERRGHSLAARLAWPVYLFYVKNQADYVRRFDPYTSARLNAFPDFSTERAEIYARHAAPVMRLWRSWFGFGSLVFGLALFIGLGIPEYYMLFRVVLLNALFYGYLRPAQQSASRAAFREMKLRLPDQA